MILRALPMFARFDAHLAATLRHPLCGAARRGMVPVSAPVPNAFGADDNKTRYPSPSRRSASFLGRPPFLMRLSQVLADGRNTADNPTMRNDVFGVMLYLLGISTGEPARCESVSRFPLPFLLPPSPSPAVLAMTSSARLQAPSSAASALLPLAAISRPALSSAAPLARFATTSTSADFRLIARLRAVLSDIPRTHRCLSAPVGFFVSRLGQARSCPATKKGQPTCSRNC